MKTAQTTRQITTKTAESRDFTIKANGKAFKILIDGLYENKAQSIVREIWSNALDSHVAAGIPKKPFSVTFPSIYNPTFVVRDYGTSLSHEDVMGLYSTVFESTKEDTNSAVGKFGLGSKSPFAYTDTFTVTAFMDGKKRVYTSLISEDGVPQIHFMGQMDTEEPDGLEVSFSIENRDIEMFRKAALRVSHGFDVKPEVIQKPDEPEFEGWPELEIMSEGNGWKLLSGYIEGYRAQAYAKMGCVLYPINADAIDGLAHDEKRLLQSTLVMDFAVGELEINASREALSYGTKDPTAESIRARIKAVVTEMVDTFMSQYAEAATYWEACQLFREHVGSAVIPHAVRDVLKSKAAFDGKPLQVIQSIGRGKSADVRIPQKGIQVCSISGPRLNNALYRFDYSTADVTIPAIKDVVFFLEDLECKKKTKYVPSKIKAAYQEEKFGHVVWIKYHGGREAAQALMKMVHTFDGADFRLVSDLPDIARNGNTGTYVKRPVQVRVLTYGRFSERTDLSAEEVERGGFYVPMERNCPQTMLGCMPPETVWTRLQQYPGLIPSDAKLYGIPKTLWSRFKGKQWVNVYDFAQQVYRNNQSQKQVAEAQRIELVVGDPTLRFIAQRLREVPTVQNSVVAKALALYDEAATADKPAVSHVIALAKALGHEDKLKQLTESVASEFHAMKAELKKRYPLLGAFDQWYMRDSLDKLEHYIYVCDVAAEHDSAETEIAADVAA